MRASVRQLGGEALVFAGAEVRDVEFVAAFDIDKNKVGKDLSQAIFTFPNNTTKFSSVPHLGVPVHRGMTHDGLGQYLSQIIEKAPGSTDDIVGILKETRADVVISYLPVGSEEATKWYVEQILDANCGFINCVPVFIARERYGEISLMMALLHMTFLRQFHHHGGMRNFHPRKGREIPTEPEIFHAKQH